MTAPDSTPNGGPSMGALGRELERVSRRVAELDALVRQLAEDIIALAPPADGGEEPEALRSWLTVDDGGQARQLLADLTAWLATVYRRFPDGTLPSCWLWHPAVVEELWWLRNAHHEAYAGDRACWRDVGDWHDRQRPGVIRRVREAVGDCELSRHMAGGDRAHRAAPVPLTSAADQLADHWVTHGSPPEPGEDQLGDAERYDHPHARSGR